MMVSAFISTLRREYNDLPEKHRDVRTGDGSSTVYKTKYSPILENSLTLYNGTSAYTSAQYSVDYDTGDIVLVSATSNEVRAEYKGVDFTDEMWLEFTQGAIEELGDEFFRMTTRSTSGLTLSANVVVYDMPTGCIRVIEALQSDDYTSGGNFSYLNTNTRYDRRSNKLILGQKPTKGNYAQISYCRRVAIPTATSSVLDIEDNWAKLLNIKVGEISTRSFADRIAKQGNASVEEGHLSVATLRTLANDLLQKFEMRKKRIKPILPASRIPFYIHGGGDVG